MEEVYQKDHDVNLNVVAFEIQQRKLFISPGDEEFVLFLFLAVWAELGQAPCSCYLDYLDLLNNSRRRPPLVYLLLLQTQLLKNNVIRTSWRPPMCLIAFSIKRQKIDLFWQFSPIPLLYNVLVLFSN